VNAPNMPILTESGVMGARNVLDAAAVGKDRIEKTITAFQSTACRFPHVFMRC